MASEREQKQLEAGSEAIGSRLFDLRSSLGQLILKLETDPNLNWHSFLDSYALASGEKGFYKSYRQSRVFCLLDVK